MGNLAERLLSFGIAVWMRVLVIVLLVSVAALLFVAIAAARHVWRQRNRAGEEPAQPETEQATGRVPEQRDKALTFKPDSGLE